MSLLGQTKRRLEVLSCWVQLDGALDSLGKLCTAALGLVEAVN
jgi:hypothetical protein